MPVSINNPANVIINNGAIVTAANPIPPVVQNGLVLNLDAGNVFSYPTVGNTWYDLGIESTNTSLINGPSFNFENRGYIRFDGSNDYAIGTTPSNSSLNVTLSGIATIEVVFRLLSLNVTNINLFDYGYSYGIGVSSVQGWRISSGAPGSGALAGSIIVNELAHWTIIIKNTPSRWIYKNGIQVGTHSANGPQTKTVDDILINTNRNLAGYLNMDFGLLRVYNRELTATEVLQNFNASRWRFGI